MILFTYDFMHRKSQDFILKLIKDEIEIDLIVGAPNIDLEVPRLSFNTKLNIKPIFHSKELAKKFNIPYLSISHNSEKLIEKLKLIKPKIGMIAGARIIDKKIIDCFSIGILNFHPGDIPIIRGLYSSLRAVKINHPQTVTSHIIDEKIDSGVIIIKKKVKVEKHDTIFHINEKLYQTQLDIISESYYLALNNKFEAVVLEANSYDNQLPYNDIKSFEKDFKNYLR